MSLIDAAIAVAYAASDVVINHGVAAPPSTSPAVRVFDIPQSADSSSTLAQHAKSVSLITLNLASSTSLIQLLPTLSSLTSTPIVVNAVYSDLSDVFTLRSAVPYILHSSSRQEAQDQAIVAAKLARTLKRPVLHAITATPTFSEDFTPVPEDLIKDLLEASQTNGHDPLNGGLSTFDAYRFVLSQVCGAIGRDIAPYKLSGQVGDEILLVAAGRHDALISSVEADNKSRLISLSLLHPFPASQPVDHAPESISKIVVLEPSFKRTTKWTPLYLDVVTAAQERDPPSQVYSAALGLLDGEVQLSDLVSKLTPNSSVPLAIGQVPASTPPSPVIPNIPKHEASYTKILSHVFGDRLEVLNDPTLVSSLGEAATRPEYALGRARAISEERAQLEQAVRDVVETDSSISPETHKLLTTWLTLKDDPVKGPAAAEAVRSSTSLPPAIESLKSHLSVSSRWIIGSDAWSYDLGSSGLHHLIASNLNVNILLIDNTPYTLRDAADPSKRKKDAGLYAMNHGDAFVASIAVYSSYSQSLHALMEADKYRGPSVVLAYLPYASEEASALSVLKETKLAVDTGYWPLYRWDPSNEDHPFVLESEAVKADLQEFLDRQNHLSQLTRAQPDLAVDLVSSLGTQLADARREKAKQSYAALLDSIEGPPLLVLYASDGGNAEKVAKRLVLRAKARGVAARISSFDGTPIEEWKNEQHIAFVTSTAGQGEPPQNGRDTFRAINAAVAKGEKLFAVTAEEVPFKYSVFGMGDSHYWPRPEDAGYYNRPGKDLDARLEQLGAERMASLGLGDDQDADGPQTGYKLWEPLLWKALGVDSVEVKEAEPEPITNENIKIASNFLRGTIAEGLKDTSTGALAASDGQLTKFHGIYEQDDRDIREERKDAGLEPAYSFMIRVRMPGGVCDPNQWLAMDRIADERGNGTFKLTTRQTFQFHGVIKKHLKPSIQAINRALLDTIAACGDVNRNVLCSALPDLSHLHTQVYEFSKKLSEHLLPRMTAYHEIWLDKKLVAGDAVKDFEPLYGPYYLPRKFKIAVAVPPTNDVDVFCNDVGFIAIADEMGNLRGFNVTAGGGMGVTHSNKKTYPRTADVLGFCTPEQGHKVAEAIMLTQRDNGNRADRKNARLKYTIDRMGLDAFKAEVEQRLGYPLEPARPYTFTANVDKFGWHKDYRGKNHFVVFIENGRVEDVPGKEFKTGLKEIAKVHKGKFRLTANQHLILSDVDDKDLDAMKVLLRKWGLDNYAHSGLRLSSSACVAFPTCGLAMAESERYLPILIDKVEAICEENGLRHDSIVMRMTGCPNGCARPYVAEIAFVGKAPGSYLMLLGGGYYGQRLNKIYRENVTEPEILAILKPMIKRYALERHDGEHFGDFVIRAGYISATKSGKEWYDGMGGEGQYKELKA